MGWQGENLVKLAINKLNGDLHTSQAVLARKINGPLGVLEVEGVMVVCSPVAQPSEVELRAGMLQQNFHGKGLSFGGRFLGAQSWAILEASLGPSQRKNHTHFALNFKPELYGYRLSFPFRSSAKSANHS